VCIRLEDKFSRIENGAISIENDRLNLFHLPHGSIVALQLIGKISSIFAIFIRMRKLLVIAREQEKLGSKPGPHTFKKSHEEALHKTFDGNLEVVIATPEEATQHFQDAEIVAAFPMRVPSLDQVPQAKWLHTFSAGVDKILTPELAASHVLLTNSSGIHATPIAEYIIGSCLMFARQFHVAIRNQLNHVWNKEEGGLSEMSGKTMLIIGLGEIGRETARLAHAFGMRVIGVSRSGKNKPTFVAQLETSEKLDALLPEADFVVITLPGTPETNKLFDNGKISRMKKSATLVNIGRGGIVDENALANALNGGEIAGAAFDVFETEPLPKDSPLWDIENMIITPHNSGLSEKYMDRAIELLIKNIHGYLKGEPLPNEVNKQLGY
jgi:phosphoglycerate dehydrogenase-like enzyme